MLSSFQSTSTMATMTTNTCSSSIIHARKDRGLVVVQQPNRNDNGFARAFVLPPVCIQLPFVNGTLPFANGFKPRENTPPIFPFANGHDLWHVPYANRCERWEVHDASRCTMPQGARCSSRYADMTTMRIQYNNNTTTRIPGWRRRRQKQGYDDDNDEDMWCWQWWGYAVRNHLTLIAIVKNNLMSMRLKSLSMYKGVSTRSNNYQSTRWLWVNHPVQARKAITQSKHVAHCSLLDGGCVVIVACLYPSSRPDWECRWQQQRVENREFAEVSSWSVIVSDAVMMYFRNGRSNIAIEIVDEDLLEKAFTESLVMEEETRKGDLSNEEDLRIIWKERAYTLIYIHHDHS